MTRNYDLKDEIRDYWSARATTFDKSPGHHIRTTREFLAYEKLIRRHAPGLVGAEVLDAACGTGEVTRLLRRLGCRVTGVDLSSEMADRCRSKHAGDPEVTILEGDVERLTLPDQSVDAVICRNLVWTLTDPEAAFGEWLRVLRPGGVAVAFEGNWMKPSPFALLLRRLSQALGRKVESAQPDFTEILARLPFRNGMTPELLKPKLSAAGFPDANFFPMNAVTLAQLSQATWAERLSLLSFSRGRFMMVATSPAE